MQSARFQHQQLFSNLRTEARGAGQRRHGHAEKTFTKPDIRRLVCPTSGPEIAKLQCRFLNPLGGGQIRCATRPAAGISRRTSVGCERAVSPRRRRRYAPTGGTKGRMTEYALILISTVLVNNFVLVKFLGLCPFMGVSRKLETAMGMGLATTFVLTLSSVSSYLVNEYILGPLDVEYLRTIAFILVIAVVVQFTEMVMHKTSPLLYQVLGIFLPLITTNCAVLGVALLNIQEQHSFVESALYGFGAAVGFSLVLVLFAAVRERVAVADVPEPFQGNAIALVTAGLMSMAFMGFAGLVTR
jgi:electron transport complex protein RnfA